VSAFPEKFDADWLDEPAPGRFAATAENVAAAREFALLKWKERAAQFRLPEPHDLTDACNFTSLFARALFGGRIEGNWHHRFNVLPDGTRLDLDAGAADVRALGEEAYLADPEFMAREEFLERLPSCAALVERWLAEFTPPAPEPVDETAPRP
jgi:hypothetical protein